MATAVPEVQIRAKVKRLTIFLVRVVEKRSYNNLSKTDFLSEQMRLFLHTLVVSSDHNYTDACKTAKSDRGCHLCPGWIQHAHTADKRQISLGGKRKK